MIARVGGLHVEICAGDLATGVPSNFFETPVVKGLREKWGYLITERIITFKWNYLCCF